jgi:hypothetical protein
MPEIIELDSPHQQQSPVSIAPPPATKKRARPAPTKNVKMMSDEGDSDYELNLKPGRKRAKKDEAKPKAKPGPKPKSPQQKPARGRAQKKSVTEVEAENVPAKPARKRGPATADTTTKQVRGRTPAKSRGTNDDAHEKSRQTIRGMASEILGFDMNQLMSDMHEMVSVAPFVASARSSSSSSLNNSKTEKAPHYLIQQVISMEKRFAASKGEKCKNEDVKTALEQLQIAYNINDPILRYQYMIDGDLNEARKDIEEYRAEGWQKICGRISPAGPEMMQRPILGSSQNENHFEMCVQVRRSVCRVLGCPLTRDLIGMKQMPNESFEGGSTGKRRYRVESYNNPSFWLEFEV